MRTFSAGIIVALFVPQILFLVQEKPRDPITRAKRPKFEKTEGVFFNNLFEEALVGERPKNLGSANQPKIVKNGEAPNSGDNSSVPSGGSYPWSKLIAAGTIEDEVKSIKMNLDKTITTPTKFASGDSKIARVDYSVLAMLFAIVSEYDGEVKWKKYAGGARDAFAKCAANASTSTEQAYQQAKQRKQDLADMLNGGSVSFANSDEANDWSKICDRTPLMLRMKVAYFNVIKPGTANAGEFKSNKEAIAREAALIATIGEVLTRNGMEDGDDESYASHAKTMTKGALDILEAIKLDSVDQASKAAGVIDQACDKCHEDWK